MRLMSVQLVRAIRKSGNDGSGPEGGNDETKEKNTNLRSIRPARRRPQTQEANYPQTQVPATTLSAIVSPKNLTAFAIDQAKSNRSRWPRNIRHLAYRLRGILSAQVGFLQDCRPALGRYAEKLKPKFHQSVAFRDDAPKSVRRSQACKQRLAEGA